VNNLWWLLLLFPFVLVTCCSVCIVPKVTVTSGPFSWIVPTLVIGGLAIAGGTMAVNFGAGLALLLTVVVANWLARLRW
jgi:hypothetical protein